MTEAPTLFLSHGSPTLPFDPYMRDHAEALHALATELPRPSALIVLSAHWDTRTLAISNDAAPRSDHNLSRMPPVYFQLNYPAKGAPELAQEVAALCAAAELPCTLASRGYDEAVWVPLLVMYPDGAIPVLQLSIQTHLPPAHMWRIGELLKPLRRRGIMVVGSGTLAHPAFHEISMQSPRGVLLPWVQAFVDWIDPRILAFDREALLDYRTQAPFAARVHPHQEHLYPLFAAMGAASPGELIRKVNVPSFFGTGCVDSYVFG